MASCSFDGNSDMYGLGIRLGFYLQWYGAILAQFLAPSEVPNLRLTNNIFIFASFTALVIQRNNLQSVEIYIILLLYFGSSLYILPVVVWRLLTGCDPDLDPTRFSHAPHPSELYNLLDGLLLLAVMSFMVWFWTTRVPELDDLACQGYGFIFAMVKLNNTAFRIFNLIVDVALLATIYILLALRYWPWSDDGRDDNTTVSSTQRETPRYAIFRTIHAVMRLTVAAVVNVATELTITWNHITGVDTVGTAGQTIPLIIGCVAVVRIFYIRLFPVVEHERIERSDGPDNWRDLPPRMGVPPPLSNPSGRGPSDWRDIPLRMGAPPPSSSPSGRRPRRDIPPRRSGSRARRRSS